ncbi:MAG: DUF1343 domain-containing protein [Acidobacteriota bacterium]
MKIGLETLFEQHLDLLRGQRVGLIVHPASINQHYQHAADIFYSCQEFKLTALYGPQHGIRGETQDNMIEWEGFTDRRTGLPVYSLYGETRIPSEEMLKDIDVLVFDAQDVGTRVYTFIYTMAYAMQSCARYGRRMIVLDRPNPIGGEMVEGNILDTAFASFVGLYPIPMRHGMTVGELAQLFNKEFQIHCQLDIVPMDGWQRAMWWEDTKLPWILPSPNMPTLDTATVYPGMVIFEGTMVSEGRGTTRPFEIIGAPYIDPYQLTDLLNAIGLSGVYFRPLYFQPTFHKHAGQLCGGLQVHVLDRQQFQPVITGVAILKAIYDLYKDHFEWKSPPYEYVVDQLPIDVIYGTDTVRKEIEANGSLDKISQCWQEQCKQFLPLREKYLLYR